MLLHCGPNHTPGPFCERHARKPHAQAPVTVYCSRAFHMGSGLKPLGTKTDYARGDMIHCKAGHFAAIAGKDEINTGFGAHCADTQIQSESMGDLGGPHDVCLTGKSL